MKKIMVLLALAAGIQLANAQKSEEACKKAVASAKAASQDPKKNVKVATWMNLAKASMEAYNAPQLNGMLGHGRQEIQLLLTGIKPVSTTTETLGSGDYIVDHYASCDYYYSPDEILQMIVVTRPYVQDALPTALEAYSKAAEVDVKGSKKKDILAGIENIVKAYQDEAMNEYQFGRFLAASERFESAADAAATAPLSRIDSACIYNSGLTAYMAGNFERTKTMMEKCIELGYYEGGETFAKLAESQKQLKDTVACKATLEKGFELCPDNQSILVGLINLYLETNDDPSKLFTLLDIAKIKEPANASLYYVEGNIRKQLGQIEEAVAAYDKCVEVNPDYEFGYIGKGLLYYDEAIKYVDQAQNEFDQKKYEALEEKAVDAFKLALPAFEKAFGITKELPTKVGVAEYIKNISFRFRRDAEYQEIYDKYNEFVKANS